MHKVVIDDTNTDVVGNDLLQLSAKGIKLIKGSPLRFKPNERDHEANSLIFLS